MLRSGSKLSFATRDSRITLWKLGVSAPRNDGHSERRSRNM